MAWSLVQQSVAQTTTSTNTLPAPSTSGNLLVAVTGAPNQTAITAPAGWLPAASVLNGNVNQSVIWYYPNNPGGLSSFTFAGPPGIFSVVAEFSNPAPRAAVSDTGAGTAGAIGSVSVTTGGEALAGDLVVCAAFEHLSSASAVTWTDPSPFTEFAGLKTSSLVNHGYAAYTVSAPASGAQSATVTSSVASTLATGWTGLLAAFTPAALPPVPQPVRPQVITPRRGQAYAGGKGAPLRNPTSGRPVLPLPGPVQARVPLPPRGRVSSGRGAPLRNPVTAAPVYPAKGPVQARRPLPAKGRAQAAARGPVRNPGAGPAAYPPQGPVAARQPLPPRGRAASNASAPVRAASTGPRISPLRGPAGARQPLPPRGRTAGTAPPPAAVTLANTFETGLSPGTAVSAGNSGTGQAGSAFDSVTVAAGGTVAYDSANIIHGGLDGKFQATSAGANYVSWIKSLGNQPQVWFRVYCYLSALPGQNLWLFSALQGATLCARFGITPSGQVLIQGAAQVSVATSVNRVPAGTGNWFRLEGWVNGVTGSVAARLFTTPDSPTPLETVTAGPVNTGGVMDRVRFGVTAASGVQGPLWLDDIAVSNAGWLGPTVSVAEPSQGFPAQARAPALTPRSRGQALSTPVTPVAGTAPVPAPFAAATQAVRARSPLPPAGRVVHGNPGAPVVNPAAAVPPLAQRQPVTIRRALPPGGRAAGNAGAPAALRLSNSFEGGSNGVTVTTGNSGGASGNAFGATTGPPAGGTLAYDSTLAAHGGVSAKLATAATAGSVTVKWTQNRSGNNGVGQQQKIWFRLYAFFPANPTTATGIFRTFGGGFGAGGSQQGGGQLLVLTTGALQFQNGTGAALVTSASLIPLNSWFRVEGFVSASPGTSTGQVSFSLFWPLDSVAAVETQTSSASAAAIRGPIAEADFGHPNSTANIGPFWLDDIAVSNTGPLGPVSFTAAPSSGQAVQARGLLPSVPFLRGRTSGSRGAPLASPVPGPALAPLRRPVQAKIPRTYRGQGHHGNPGAPVRNPQAAVAFPAASRTVAARRMLPMAGRATGNDGAPVVNPLPAFPVYSPTGFYGANVLTGPPASVLAEVLRSDGSTGGRQRATFTTSQYTTAYPDLPSLITQVVWLC